MIFGEWRHFGLSDLYFVEWFSYKKKMVESLKAAGVK
jgi:hypothetical protein